MNGFLIQCKSRKTELLQYLGIMAGAFVVGFIILLIVMGQTEENESAATAGTMMAVVLIVFIHFFATIISFVGQFNLAVSMGATRKNFVANYALFNMSEILLLEIGLVILGNLEKFIASRLFPNVVMEIDMTKFFDWKYLLAAIVVLTVSEIFLGAVILRFGMKFFWVLWAIWMLAALLPLNISKNEKLSGELAKIGFMIGGKITPAGIVTAVSLVCLILIAITWKILKRQRVTA